MAEVWGIELVEGLADSCELFVGAYTYNKIFAAALGAMRRD